MKIGYLQKTSLIEYPGKVCGIVFTQGCNFRCPYCHNPELVDPALFGECLPMDDILSFLAKRRGKLDAVTITGGEPTIHEGLPGFIRRIKELGYLVKIDTNGSNPGVLRQIIADGLADFIAMDIKSPLARYPEVTGAACDVQRVESSIRAVMRSNVAYEFRTTIASGLLSPDDILEIGRMIRGASRYVLQKFVPSKHLDQAYLKAEPFSEEEIEDLLDRLTELVGHVSVR
ncbi:MAG TPA: anaerobic ribonucleoside-triphosphate reductase activating protein [Deltaproteobacteria bacterium]|nr:anaerobic ribonucleoside-triphosphate reductase activating protein [Deltaproteobacteria bacterium]